MIQPRIFNVFIFDAVLPIIVALTTLIAAPLRAQQLDAGRPSEASAALKGSTPVPVPMLRPSPWGTNDVLPPLVNRPTTTMAGAGGTDPNAPFFLPAAIYASGGVSPDSVAVADLNGDGAPDVVVAHFCEPNGCSQNVGGVSVLLNRGDGTFLPAVSYSSGGFWGTSITIADLNGDHKPDLVVANCGPVGLAACQTGNAVIGILLGNGDGTFQSAVAYESGGQGAYSVAVADVNGDGKLDLLVAHIGGTNSPNGEVGVLLGNGDGTFQAATTYPAGGWGTYSLDVRDVNQDGKADLVVVNSCGNPENCTKSSVGVLLGYGDGTFQPVVLYDAGGRNALFVVVADVNRDGKPDLLVAIADPLNSNDEGAVSVLLGNGDGTFQAAVLYDSGGFGAWSIGVADVNGDGKLDVLVTNFFDITVGLLLGNGDGTFQPVMTYESGGSSPASVAIADVNGDGKPDFVVAECPITGCGDTGQVGVLLHVGSTATITTLISSPNPSVFGQLVTFTATVTSASATPMGTVTLFDNSTALGTATLVNGSASTSISTLVPGPHSITAMYQGSLQFNSSTSAVLHQTVNHAVVATSTSLISSLNPSARGQEVTFTAAVSSSGGVPPSGETVTFSTPNGVLGTGSLVGGTASLTRSLPSGIFTISAAYFGDANFGASASPDLLQFVDTKNQSPTTITLASSLNPSIYGQTVTFRAIVSTTSSVPPTGKVVFRRSSSAIEAVTLNSGGVATLTEKLLNASLYPLTAEYVGDASNGPSSSGLLNQVVTQANSVAKLTSTPNPSLSGQAVTFTALITSTTVNVKGPVTFIAGNKVLGTAQLVGGKANFTISTLPAGSTKITVTYVGDSNISKSSASLAQTVH